MMDVEYESLFIRELMKMASLASQFQSYNKIRQISIHFNHVINRYQLKNNIPYIEKILCLILYNDIQKYICIHDIENYDTFVF